LDNPWRIGAPLASRRRGEWRAGVAVDDPYGRLVLDPADKTSYGKGHQWSEKNDEDARDQQGEDNVLPWDRVVEHDSGWIAAFKI
jgi:hypothetical protein